MEPTSGAGTADQASKAPHRARGLVTVAMCTHGRAATLDAACRSVVSELRDGDELLLVVDGGDVDRVRRVLDALAYRDVSVVHQPPLGVAAARQHALDAARGDVVCFVDDDVVVHRGWRDALVAPFANPHVGMAAGSIVPVWPAGRRPAWIPDRLMPSYGARRAERRGAHPPYGANMAVHRATALAAGGFSTELGHQPGRPGLHEDAELWTRLEAAGATLAEVPGAVVDHHVRPEQIRLRWILTRAWHEGRADARLARTTGRPDGGVRAVKLVALIGALPLAALHTRARTYVLARILVNTGYLSAVEGTRRR